MKPVRTPGDIRVLLWSLKKGIAPLRVGLKRARGEKEVNAKNLASGFSIGTNSL